VQWTQLVANYIGAEHVATFQKTELSQRQYCTKCGGRLMTNHPPLGLVDVFAATNPRLPSPPRTCDLCLSGLASRPISPGWAVADAPPIG
jgi:hypothetical protein